MAEHSSLRGETPPRSDPPFFMIHQTRRLTEIHLETRRTLATIVKKSWHIHEKEGFSTKPKFYKLLAPRVTVCVSTLSSEGKSNLAPYSFVTPLSFNPPLVGVAVGRGKDTLVNARETQEFVISPLTKDWMEKGVQTEISLDREESEFEEVGLTESSSEEIKTPGVEEAPINIECVYFDDFGAGDHFLLVGEVVNVTAKEGATRNGRINLEELASVGHISGEEFCISDESVNINRE